MSTLPRHMTLEVTARCNFRCPFCYCVWHESPAPPPRDLSTERWKTIIRRCAADGVTGLLFTGGEAVLRSDLRELILYGRSLLPGARLELFTNGSRMTEELFFFCRDHEVRISASLPGLRTYPQMTGTRRTGHKILKFIAFAAENGWPVNVSITAAQANREEFADIFSAAALSGAHSIQMGAVMPEGRGRRHPELFLSRQEWETLKERIRELPDGGVPYCFCDEMLCECRPQPPELLRRFADPARAACPAGKEFGVIGPDGRFRKCLHHPESIPFEA